MCLACISCLSTYVLLNYQASGSTRTPSPISVLRFWISEGLLEHDIDFKGWTTHAHRDFAENAEKTTLGRDCPSGEIGRIAVRI